MSSSPLKAVLDILKGETPSVEAFHVAALLGWVTGTWKAPRVRQGFKWAARGRVFPPMQCPHCGATHFPHGGPVGRCSQCQKIVLEPEWLGECTAWPLEVEKHRWRR